MSNKHEFERLVDTLALTEEEFGRFMPDFAAWWVVCKSAKAIGADPVNMTWVDDGLPGQIHHVTLMVKETGQELVIPGPAYQEAP